MKATTLREFVEMADRVTCAAFENSCGELHALYLVVDGDGVRSVIPAPPLPKSIAVDLVRTALREMGATRVVLIDEAWQLSGGPEIQELVDETGSIENAPGRVEIVLYAAEDEREGFLSASRQILREDGVARLGPLVFVEGGRAEGRMVGLLPSKGRVH